MRQTAQDAQLTLGCSIQGSTNSSSYVTQALTRDAAVVGFDTGHGLSFHLLELEHELS
ncbi:MAG: hypothetical protein E6R03_11525 [Hyphomicrobiaceae bacterium]|nr:MAG: hypothetical protein E6R03_11525 [Hyphomicrobiaceae bacterium]